MSRMRGVWRAAGSLVVVGLLVSACTGGDPEPATTSAAPVVESPTPAPSPTRDLTRLPERPAAMDEPTTEGAIAAATYVLDLFTYSFASGDTGPWRAITAASCEFCVGMAGDVEEMAASGESSSGAAIVVEQAEAQEIAEDRWFGVDMIISQEPAERVDVEGNVVAAEPGGRYSAAFAMSWDDGWRVDQLGFEKLASAQEE